MEKFLSSLRSLHHLTLTVCAALALFLYSANEVDSAVEALRQLWFEADEQTRRDREESSRLFSRELGSMREDIVKQVEDGGHRIAADAGIMTKICVSTFEPRRETTVREYLLASIGVTVALAFFPEGLSLREAVRSGLAKISRTSAHPVVRSVEVEECAAAPDQYGATRAVVVLRVVDETRLPQEEKAIRVAVTGSVLAFGPWGFGDYRARRRPSGFDEMFVEFKGRNYIPPKLQGYWFAIADKPFAEAFSVLRGDPSARSVNILGLTFSERVVTLVGPAVMAGLLGVMLLQTIRIRSETSMEGVTLRWFPWSVLFPAPIGVAVAWASFVAFPSVVLGGVVMRALGADLVIGVVVAGVSALAVGCGVIVAAVLRNVSRAASQ